MPKLTNAELTKRLNAAEAMLAGNTAVLPSAAAAVVVAGVLGTDAQSAIIASLVNALATRDKSANLITDVCSVVYGYTKGAELSESDRETIKSACVTEKTYPNKDTLKSRRTDVEAILKAHARLPEAIKAYQAANNGRGDWHDGLRIARLLNNAKKNLTVADAVKEALPEVGPELTEEQKKTKAALDCLERTSKALKAFATKFPQHGTATQAFCAQVNLNLFGK
jgi:pyridoxal/pyridoxine/pyridoxamine kinase